jgi:(R,R)-butanediol dehydrogenase/meso-butanediol dehydrogenase/diacetyl reductase
MSQYLVAPGFSLYKLPDSVSDEWGTLVEPLAVSLHAVRLGNVRIGDTVSIVGDGPIALCAVLSAKAAGASAIYVVAKHKRRGAIAREFGATQVIYPSDGDPVKLIRDITNGLGADVSFECVGRSESLQLAVELARKGGTTVVIGVFDGPITFDMGAVLFNEKTIIGSPIYVDEARLAIDLLATGKIDPSALITSTVPLADAVKSGFDGMLVNKEDNVKVLIKMP